jgi:hypothetical protein
MSIKVGDLVRHNRAEIMELANRGKVHTPNSPVGQR